MRDLAEPPVAQGGGEAPGGGGVSGEPAERPFPPDAGGRRGSKTRDPAGLRAQSAGVGDVGELYGELSRRLEQIVRVDVRAPDAVIEDACQFAWSRLVHHHDRVHRETSLAWLVKTAVHEAFKLIRRDGRELSLEAALEASSEATLPLGAPAPDELVVARERLAQLGALPERQQRLLWLQGLGLTYEEMAQRTGCTQRTVERQLLRAKRSVRGLEAE